MWKIYKYCCLISILFVSCSKDILFDKNQDKISKDIKEIIRLDQQARSKFLLIDKEYKIRNLNTVCDSLLKEGHTGNFNEIMDFSKIPTFNEQLNHLSSEEILIYNEKLRVALQEERQVDKRNQEKMYKIIKKYGYPSFYNRMWKDTVSTRIGMTFVLTHFDYSSLEGKNFIKLMLREFEKGRVEEGEMRYFLWNLDDRPGVSYDYVIDLEKFKRKTNE